MNFWDILGQYGLPVAACIVLGWYVYRMQKDYTTTLNTILQQRDNELKTVREEHREETKEMARAVDRLSDLITELLVELRGQK